MSSSEMNLVLVGGSLVALIGGCFYWSGSHWSKQAQSLCEMKVETVKSLRDRAESLEIGPAVIRGVVRPAIKGGALTEDSITGGVVVQDVTYTSVHLAVKNAKLVERRKFLQRKHNSVDWVISDGETGVVRLDASLKGNLPLQTIAPSMIAVRDPGHLQVLISEHGFALQSSRDKERVIGIERSSSVLATGSLLTVVGHATLDTQGGLLFSMGVGPCTVSSMPLSAIIESWFSYASNMKIAGVAIGVLAGVIIVGGGIYAATPKTKRREENT